MLCVLFLLDTLVADAVQEGFVRDSATDKLTGGGKVLNDRYWLKIYKFSKISQITVI